MESSNPPPKKDRFRGEMDSGTEFALQALQSQIKMYTDDVKERFVEIKDHLKDHTEKQEKWQKGIEGDLRQALAYGPRLEKLECKVGEHDKMYMASKGVVWATKLVWIVFGVLASSMIWAYSQFTQEKTSTNDTPPKSSTH